MAVSASCTTNIYLVRHAEKLDATSNTVLSPRGEQRAIVLCEILKDKNIDSIYATNYKRTQLTAKPLSDVIGKEILVYYSDEKFSEHLKNLKGQNVLVVGHSNTIPEIIRYLTSENVQIDEDDFDNLFIIKITRFLKTKISFEAKTYGTPSP